MTCHACPGPIEVSTLLEYWLGELDQAQEERLDEHLLGCGHCSMALQSLVDLGIGIRSAVRSGAVHVAVPSGFTERLAAEGLRLRTYRVPANESVYCTVAPDDDLLITRLAIPAGETGRLDLVCVSSEGAPLERLDDVPFDVASGEVILTSRMDRVRSLPASTLRYRLLAVVPPEERVIGEYTFHHTPHSPAGGR